jgi:hypothetical protein
MRQALALVLRLSSVPVGVGVGFWTAQLTPGPYTCPPNGLCLLMNVILRPTFATWQCIVFGADAAAVVLLMSLAVSGLPAATARQASQVAAALAGIGVGLWIAQLQSLEQCPSFAGCPSPNGLVFQSTFAPWQCGLFGAGAAVLLLLLSLAASRLPSARGLEAS